MKSQYPLLRPAIWLHRYHQQCKIRLDRVRDSTLDSVLYHSELLIQHARACRNATSRGWHAAVAQMDTRIAADLHRLQYATTEAQNKTRRPTELPQPTLRDLYEDLIQIHQEFVKVTIDPKHHLLAAVTDSIELDGVYLGDFRLELHLDRLHERVDVSAFDVVALDPHPPDSSEDVTHPHVRDCQLCAGEATAPIAQALRDGRFCDAFLAVNSVLHEYNPHSPYVSLENWRGVACADCGSLTNEDSRYYCEDCSQEYCADCYTTCDICESSFCRSCLEEDKESGRSCCRSCRQNCQRCGRIVDADSFDEATNLCPGCLDQRQPSEEPLQPEEIKHEQHEQSKTADPSPEACIIPAPV